jgi:hypothetical protein
MKQNPKWTAATLVVLAAATVHTMHALAIAPVPMVHESDGASANGSKTYDEWQAPLSRPGGFTLRIFDGLENMQIWDNAP